MRTGFLLPSDDLECRVRSALLSRSFPKAHNVEVLVENGTVTLQGTVRTYYVRQALLHACLRVPGVRTIIDEICVEA